MSEVAIKDSGNTFYMTLKAAMNLPLVRISRREFLKKELSRKYNSDIVEKAIDITPAEAGINLDEIDAIAKSCIKFETNSVTAVSGGLGLPGGLAMAATVPADITQYFGYMLRIMQKLIYLYGWQEVVNDDKGIDDETLNTMTMFMGVMFGAEGANALVRGIAASAAKSAEKRIAAAYLTKTAYYPLIKKIAAMLGVKITKQSFAKGVSKVVPVLGGVISGGITYATFKPCANKLMKELRVLPLATKVVSEQNEIIDV